MNPQEVASGISLESMKNFIQQERVWPSDTSNEGRAKCRVCGGSILKRLGVKWGYLWQFKNHYFMLCSYCNNQLPRLD